MWIRSDRQGGTQQGPFDQSPPCVPLFFFPQQLLSVLHNDNLVPMNSAPAAGPKWQHEASLIRAWPQAAFDFGDSRSHWDARDNVVHKSDIQSVPPHKVYFLVVGVGQVYRDHDPLPATTGELSKYVFNL